MNFRELTAEEQRVLTGIASLLGNGRILVATHENPDGDAFGSMLGLASLLREQGKSVECYVEQDPINSDFGFLPGWNEIKNKLDLEVDVVVIVDCNQPDRVGPEFAQWLERQNAEIVRLDHHICDDADNDSSYIRTSAASACTVVAELAQNAGWHVSRETASCLYLGLATDTGFFVHRNTGREVFELAGQLVEIGADPTGTAEEIQSNLTVEKLELLRLALGTLEEGKTSGRAHWASMVVDKDLLAASGASDRDTGALIEYVRHLKGVQVAFVVRGISGGAAKVSMRCVPPYDVQEIASKHGGGGHKFAAGVTLDMSPQEARKLIIAELEALG